MPFVRSRSSAGWNRALSPEGLVVALGVRLRLPETNSIDEDGQGAHGEEVDESDLPSFASEDALRLDVHGEQQLANSVLDDVLSLGIFPAPQRDLGLVRVEI